MPSDERNGRRPAREYEGCNNAWMPPTFRNDEAFAREQDAADPLGGFRERFCIPKAGDIAGVGGSNPRLAPGAPSECVYLVGNSLGLMPRDTPAAVQQELDDWARLGVEAHLHGTRPWYPYHEFVREPLARVVGGLPREVVAMNSLTTNLHLLMVSFYRPTRDRFKIVIEDSAFPSDSYAVQSQVEFHARSQGFDPAAGLIRLKPREGEATLRTGDILESIERDAGSIALVMLGGVNYLTGQLFNVPEITRSARSKGITVGWDLAHAAGNVPLKLHDWGCDFAAWCSYKYLNSGPGATAGAFVHERHLEAGTISGVPRFAGWWGNDPATRFQMRPEFVPVARADAWSLSNPPILSTAPLRVSLSIFDEATMPALRAKSERLTAYLASLLRDIPGLRVLTPAAPAERGCQLSLAFDRDARGTHSALSAAGIVCDFREPNVIRVAPVPLYNTFHEAWRFAGAVRSVAQR